MRSADDVRTTSSSVIDTFAESRKRPPENVEIEQALLGAIFRANAAFSRVSAFLKPEHFSRAVYGRIYEAIGSLIERGQLANPVTLKNLFDQDAALIEVGGALHLTRLAEAAVTIINAEDYGRRILDLWLRRQLIVISAEMVDAAYRADLNDDAEQQIGRATERLSDLSADGNSRIGAGVRSAGVGAAAAIGRSEAAYRGGSQLSGLTTGLTDLDKAIGGYGAAELTTIGKRPAVGGTAFAVGTTLAASQIPDLRILFFSIDMPEVLIGRRFLAAITGIPSQRQARGQLTQAEWKALADAQQALQKSGIRVDATSGLTLSQLRQRARLEKRRHGLGLIVVDHVQKIKVLGRDGEERPDAVKLSSGALHDLAKELDVPIVALSQLSRKVEEREGRRPRLEDLRFSGDLEQDSRVVLMIYRQELVLKDAEPVRGPKEGDMQFDERHSKWSRALDDSRGQAEIIVEKNGEGITGSVHCRFDPDRCVFFDSLVSQGGLWA